MINVQNLIDTTQKVADIKINTDNFGGKKFIAFVMAVGFMIFDIIIIALKILIFSEAFQFAMLVAGIYGGFVSVDTIVTGIKSKNGGVKQ